MNNLVEIFQHFNDQKTCLDFITQRRWPQGVKCVFCDHKKVYTLNGKHKRYKCAGCKKHFSATKGTIFENSQVPLQKWLVAMYLVSCRKKSISSVQLSKDIGVSQKSAWFMLMRIRHLMDTSNIKLTGTVEIDETFIGGKEGNKHRSRYAMRKRKAELQKFTGGRGDNKEPVLGMVEREGRIVLVHVKNTQKTSLYPVILKHVKEESTVYTDEYNVYTNLKHYYDHHNVHHKLGEYVNGQVHTNSVEGSFGLLKNGMRGIQHNVSPKHLQYYLFEFAFRYSNRSLTDSDRFKLVTEDLNHRLKYDTLVMRKPERKRVNGKFC